MLCDSCQLKMMPFPLLLALPIITLILYFFQTHKNTKILHAPSPPSLPFIGNLHRFDGSHTCLYRLSKQYGAVFSLKLGFRRAVVISSADAVKEIMKSHDAVFSSRPALVSLQRLSYNGLDVAFSPYNDTWREMRKISTMHLFSTKRSAESFLPIVKDEVLKMMKKISVDDASSTVTDLSETMMSFSTNNISRVSFGKSYGEEGYYGKNRYTDLLSNTDAVFAGFFVEDFLPWFRWIDRLSGMAAKLDKKTFHDMDSFCEEVIEEHMNPNWPKSMEGDIIDIMLGMIRNGSPSTFGITFDHIKALTMDILVGGSDSTSATVVWAMTSLMKKPLLMKKVQAEIRQLAGNKGLIDEQDIDKLPYFKAVVKETMRLFTPGPLLIPRETTKKCSINGYEIEAGSMVYINAWAIGRDPTKWENADEFVPERFLETDLDVRGQNPEVIPNLSGNCRME